MGGIATDTFKFYSVRCWRTHGIVEFTGKERTARYLGSRKTEQIAEARWGQSEIIGIDCFRNRADASAEANRRRDVRIAGLREQIKRLEEMDLT